MKKKIIIISLVAASMQAATHNLVEIKHMEKLCMISKTKADLLRDMQYQLVKMAEATK